MSEQNKSSKKDRKPYGIEITERPKLGFEGKTSFTYTDNGTEPITAATFGARVNEVFRALFADFVGCYFETANNQFSFSLFFDHDDHAEDEITGVLKGGNKGNTGNKTFDFINRLYNSGSSTKYTASQELIDVITPLLTPAAYNHGKPNWGNIIVDYSEQQQFYGGFRGSATYGPVMSKVKNIDINKLWKYIQGNKDDDGNKVDWLVSPTHPYAFPQYRNIPYSALKPEHWHFQITALNVTQAEQTLKLFGMSTGESNIIR